MNAFAFTERPLLVPGTPEDRAFRRRASKWFRRVRSVPRAVARARTLRSAMRRVLALSAPSRELVAETERTERRDAFAELAEKRAADAPSSLNLLIASLTRIAAAGPSAKQDAIVARLVTALATPDVAPARRPLPAGGSYPIALLVPVLGVGDPKGVKRWLKKRGVPTIQAGRSIKVRVADLQKYAALEWRTAREAYERG